MQVRQEERLNQAVTDGIITVNLWVAENAWGEGCEKTNCTPGYSDNR